MDNYSRHDQAAREQPYGEEPCSGAPEHKSNCGHCRTPFFSVIDQSTERLCGQFKNHLEHELTKNFENNPEQRSKQIFHFCMLRTAEENVHAQSSHLNCGGRLSGESVLRSFSAAC